MSGDSTAPAVLPGTRDDVGEARHNRRRALLIVGTPAAVAFVVVTLVCLAVGLGVSAVAVGAVVGLGLGLGLWRGATGMVLRALDVRQGADVELARAENIVDGLCATMGVDPPDIVVVDDATRRALAVGRHSGVAVVVVTSGLLHALDPVALEGVLAHELVHVKRGDIAPATMAAALLLPAASFLPVGNLVHVLAGRGREFRTDRLAVAVTRYPPGLREALVLMSEGPAPAPASRLTDRGVSAATRWLWTVPLPGLPGDSDVDGRVGELDAPSVRVAALAEW